MHRPYHSHDMIMDWNVENPPESAGTWMGAETRNSLGIRLRVCHKLTQLLSNGSSRLLDVVFFIYILFIPDTVYP